MGFHHSIMPRARRLAIEAEINVCLARVDTLVARLDRSDAPFEDLEAEEDADSFDMIGEAGSDDGTMMLRDLPAYAIDQSKGPTNHAEAIESYKAAIIGVERTTDGRWRPTGRA